MYIVLRYTLNRGVSKLQLVFIVIGASALVVGSLLAAALLCWILWSLFKVMRHPQWAAGAIAALVVLAIVGELPRSQFLSLSLMFAALAASPMWSAGRSWRVRSVPRVANTHLRCVEPEKAQAQVPVEKNACPSRRAMYPALAACIGENRRPTRAETHIVASRLRQEDLAGRFSPHSSQKTFAARRALLRAANAALSGH